MIKVINQEEFEKCLPMLDSPDVECRLLGWELLCGCTDLHKDAQLVWDNGTKCLFRYWLLRYNKFFYMNKYKFETVLCSSLIKDFTTQSKICFGKEVSIKLKYK